MRKSLAVHSKKSKYICVYCDEPYDIKEIKYEQLMVKDTDFCPACWQREITSFSDESMDFSFLVGLVR